MNISGHAALVTGGASGLGEAVARELARLGAKVAVLDVNMAMAAPWLASATSRVQTAWLPRWPKQPRHKAARES
jgi:NAD(P)-dependent dehydrogenase (short-subunit alcohol dehydrogenase family)